MHDEPQVKSQVATARPSIEAVIAAVAGRREPAVLDSAAVGPRRGRFTIVACDPVRSLAWPTTGENPFEGLRRQLRLLPRITCRDPEEPSAANVFPGGWIGYFAYEAGRFIERLPATTRADVGLPVARWALYDTAAIHDAATGVWTVAAVDLSGLGLGPAADRRVDDRLADWHDLIQHPSSQVVTAQTAPPTPSPVHNMTRPEYERIVERALAYIAAGDIYQVNLARRETCLMTVSATTIYLRLRRSNPAAYAAFLQWEEPAGSPAAGEAAVLSSSPELFLRLEADGQVLTRPIKGTRPRSPDTGIDEAYQRALAGSAKDRAELAMIVDLERNDLGRVCGFGSVQVVCPPESEARPYMLESHPTTNEKGSEAFCAKHPSGRSGKRLLTPFFTPKGASHKRLPTPCCSEAWPYVLESHPTVHHLVADVTGKLADGHDAIDLLRACFPGGSITGAPKVRAMEIIDELEPTERSVYTGAIGYISLAGTMTMNIAIRTLILASGQLHLYVGGGIVADSQPADEYHETEAKALGMRRALGVE